MKAGMELTMFKKLQLGLVKPTIKLNIFLEFKTVQYYFLQKSTNLTYEQVAGCSPGTFRIGMQYHTPN
jgi:hypothetical protein